MLSDVFQPVRESENKYDALNGFLDRFPFRVTG
jgi:hypothetical protein